MEEIFNSFNFSNVKPIRDVIHETLRQAIFEGKLKAGERLVESDLAEKMNVSRTPVREAIRKLEAEGLVEHLPRKGAEVREFTQAEIVEIYSIRRALEALAITYTVKNITEKEIEYLKKLIKKMSKLTEKNDTENLFDVCQEFNNILMNSCKMPRLIKLINTYQEYLKRFRFVTMASSERKQAAQRDHEEILEAIIARDEEWAEKIVKAHLQRALNAYLDNFPKKSCI